MKNKIRPIQITISDYGIIVTSKEGSINLSEGMTLRKEDPCLKEVSRLLKIDVSDLVNVLNIFNKIFPGNNK